MRRETVAWLRSSRRAAPRIWPDRATARKMRTSSQFIAGRSDSGSDDRPIDRTRYSRSVVAWNDTQPYQSIKLRTTDAFWLALPSSGRRATMRPTNQGSETMVEYGHFIGGKRVAGTSGRSQDVMQPMDGTVRGTVALASKSELRAAVENAKAAQPAWAATNPQRRVRVLMKFLELVAKEYDELAELLAREHGKTIADAKGDIQRGLEVVEVCIGAPHMMKGEFTDGAGPGIDVYSMRQPLGVVAGITPFNFPAMIPLWKIAPAIACGNAFILKPSERDPGVPMRIAELFLEAGLPAGILNVVNGDKDVVDAILDDPDIKAIGFVGSTPIAQYIYSRGCAAGKRVQCFGGAKNHMIIMPDADMDQTVDALIGAGYGSAGERCMAISVAVPVGHETAERLVEKLIPRVESLKVGPSTDSSADFGPLVTAPGAGARQGLCRHRRQGRRQARRRRPRLHDAGLRERLLHGRLPVRPRHAGHDDLQGRDLRAGALGRARQQLRERHQVRQRARDRQRRRDLHPRRRRRPRLRLAASRSAWSASTCRSRCRSPTTPSAAGRARASATSTSTARTPSASTPRPRRSPRAGRPASRMARSSSSRR